MEPGAVTPGNPLRVWTASSQSICFNGARGCNPWKHTDTWHLSKGNPRFNGARGCNPWKLPFTESGVDRIPLLQWSQGL